VESRVQFDGKCVTSRGPGTAMEYSVVLVEQLYGKEKAEEVAGPMVGIAFNTLYICRDLVIFAINCIEFTLLKIHIFIVCCPRHSYSSLLFPYKKYSILFAFGITLPSCFVLLVQIT